MTINFNDPTFLKRRQWVLQHILQPILYALAILGSSIVCLIRSEALGLATRAQFGAGYSPASNLTNNLTQTQVNFYDRNFVDNLKAETPHLRCVERRPLPENSGNTLNLFEYVTFGPDLSQAPEGTVQSGETINVLSDKIVIGNYADYLNYSRFSMQLAIDPALENGGKELAYQAALTIAYLIKNTTDGLNTIDSSVSAGSNAYNVPFNKNNITSAVASLRQRNVKPMEGGEFCGIIAPFAWGDALNDAANNSFTDVLKRTPEGQAALKELPGEGGMVQVMHWAGCAFYESTVVTITPNYQTHAGVNAYRTYIYGKDGVIVVSLGAKENTSIDNGDWRNLKVITKRYDDASVSDPAMMIGGSTAYNFNFATGVVPDIVGRVRYIDAPTNIT